MGNNTWTKYSYEYPTERTIEGETWYFHCLLDDKPKGFETNEKAILKSQGYRVRRKFYRDTYELWKKPNTIAVRPDS